MILDAGLLQVDGDCSEEIGATTECPVGDDAEMDVEPVEVLGASTTRNSVFACFVFRNQHKFCGMHFLAWIYVQFNHD